MRISVIGCGRWGSFLAWYLDETGHDVLLYGRAGSQRLAQLRETRENGLLRLGDGVKVTSDLARAVDFAETLVVSISSQGLRSLMAGLSSLGLEGKTLVLCMKGLETGTGLRLTEIAAEYAPGVKTAIWVGPGHVQDFLRGVPNCMVIDSACESTKRALVDAFSSRLIRFYYGNDLLGNEIGAASKNVIGIAAGVLDGLEMTALKGALMSRGCREIARLIVAMGGQELSAYGLAHLGDYQTTVFSPYSHNRMFGEKKARGEAYGELAEGVPTTAAILLLGKQYGVDLPICRAVDEFLNHGADPEDAIGGLFLRSLKTEFWA